MKGGKGGQRSSRPTTMTDNYITSETFRFLRELKSDNNRQWFDANKDRYVNRVRAPLLRFIEDFAPRLRRISKHFVANPKPVGGSMFRIYRDTRFSRDKSPYKTYIGIQFRHEAGKDAHAPGFYVHIEPGQVFAGAGMWHPDGASLRLIREAIVEKPGPWRRVLRSLAEYDLGLGGESLKRVPRGFPSEHPLADDLRRKDFITTATFTEREAIKPDFIDEIFTCYRRMAPLPRFLARAIGVEW